MIHRYCNARSRPDLMGEKKAHLRILTEYHPTQTLQRKEPSPWAHPEAPKKNRSWISWISWMNSLQMSPDVSRYLQMSPVYPRSDQLASPHCEVAVVSAPLRVAGSRYRCAPAQDCPGRWRQGNLAGESIIGKFIMFFMAMFNGYNYGITMV